MEVADHEVHLCFDTRHYRVRGLEKNSSLQQLRVNILATRDDLLHCDTIDLCQAKSRASFIKAAASELYVEEAMIKRDLGKMLLRLENLQQVRFEAATRQHDAQVELSDAEREAGPAAARLDPRQRL